MNIDINIYVVSIIIVLFVSLFIACAKNSHIKNNENIVDNLTECLYNNYSAKEYISKSIEECSKIKFECKRTKTYFIDGCGCGCKLRADENLVKVYCTDEQRNVEQCPINKNTVCGWYKKDIKCLKYPCAQNYDNSCLSCMDKKVYYWTAGECPT
ncbi:MAG: hypothetical protein QXG00_03335 [Candidatus Woesearchaeota archaeon]